MGIVEYHKWWTNFSAGIDKAVQNKPILRRMKKLFDVHFNILGILGVFATPKGELDCYWYMVLRAKKEDRKIYTREEKIRRIRRLIKWAIR